MSESPVADKKNAAPLDEHSISELIRFFSLLDKWDREAKGEIVSFARSARLNLQASIIAAFAEIPYSVTTGSCGFWASLKRSAAFSHKG